jgi:hypothetical protein
MQNLPDFSYRKQAGFVVCKDTILFFQLTVWGLPKGWKCCCVSLEQCHLKN